jgi:hypothetical protein
MEVSMVGRLKIAGCATLIALSTTHAQTTLVTVHGIAFDSLHSTPLSGAFVAIAGTGRSTISDSLGQFVFDSVAPGDYRFVMQHDVLESIGMSGAITRAIVSDGRDTIRVAVPSFTTLWRAACPSAVPPVDSGLIFGRVRAAAGMTLPTNTRVTAQWTDVGFDRTTGVTQHGWRAEAPIDSVGNYALCGVVIATGVWLSAAADSSITGSIYLIPLDESRLARQDLLLGPAFSDSLSRGTIQGVVIGDGDKPVRDALVVMDGVPDVRTNNRGEFIVRGVPPGTQQIEVRAIGSYPVQRLVDVSPGHTVDVSISMAKFTLLDSMRSVAKSPMQRRLAEFEQRRRQGAGHFVDSTKISKFGMLTGVIAEMPSVIVVSNDGGVGTLQIRFPAGAGKEPGTGGVGNTPIGGTKCLANVFIDGVAVDQQDLLDYRPQDIAAIEVYVRAIEIPSTLLSSIAFTASMGHGRCGVIVVWTKLRRH